MTIELSNEDRDILYELIQEAKPVPSDLMGKLVFNIADAGKYRDLNVLEHHLKSTDKRYEPVSYEEYKKREGK